ncbi:MAG: hypothetical protein ACI4LP_05845 [Anaerovoracaceae bacterium]
MTRKTISFRADDEVSKIINKVMDEKNLNQSEAISYLAASYEKNNGNNNPYYRKLLAKFSMDMETALCKVAQTGEIKYALDVMEEFECQIL